MSAILARLGLEVARVPHSDRHGLIWLSRGELCVEDGCLRFRTGGFDSFPAGLYAVPHQTVSSILLGPGSSVTHDALRIAARHGTCIMAVGEGAVRAYTSAPLRPDTSALARRQARLWADPETRLDIARRMYAWRFGEILPHKDIDVLRGIEGARVKHLYKVLAGQHGLDWKGRAYDRNDPNSSDEINQAINHAATAMYAAAAVSVYAVGTIPQLGFIHEDSGDSFCLDIADLYRTSDMVPMAFEAIKEARKDLSQPLERIVRKIVGKRLKTGGLIDKMITRQKELFNVGDDDGSNKRR